MTQSQEDSDVQISSYDSLYLKSYANDMKVGETFYPESGRKKEFLLDRKKGTLTGVCLPKLPFFFGSAVSIELGAMMGSSGLLHGLIIMTLCSTIVIQQKSK